MSAHPDNVLVPEFPVVEGFVTRRELARMMRVSTKTIDRWVKAGMPSETWGLRARYFQPAVAMQWARNRRTAA